MGFSLKKSLNLCGPLYQIIKMSCSSPVSPFLQTHGRSDGLYQDLCRYATAAKRVRSILHFLVEYSLHYSFFYTVLSLDITFPCTVQSRNSSASALGISTFRDWFGRIGMRQRGWRVGFPTFLQLKRSLAAQSRSVFH